MEIDERTSSIEPAGVMAAACTHRRPEATREAPAVIAVSEYERVVDPKYLDQVRTEAKAFSTKRLARRSRLGECTIRNFKNGKGNIRPGSLRKLMVAIHDLQNKTMKN
jgi:hypothetical protein